jgi:hypothetical protein
MFSEVPPLASDALLTTPYPLLENVLQTVCSKFQVDSGTGGFNLSRSFLRLCGRLDTAVVKETNPFNVPNGNRTLVAQPVGTGFIWLRISSSGMLL